MDSPQSQVVKEIEREAEKMKYAVVLVTAKLAQNQRWAEHFTLLNRRYRIESYPDSREIIIRPFEM